MSYASVSDVCAALGLDDVDARRAAIIERLIDTAEAMVDDFCNCSFDQAYRQEELWGEGSHNVFPLATNITRVIWAGIDRFSVIKIADTNVAEFSWEKHGTIFAITVDGTRYETSFAYDDTLQDVLDWLNDSTTSVIATFEDDDLAAYPAWSIYDQTETWAEGRNTSPYLYIEAAIERLSAAFRPGEGFLTLDRCAGEGQVVKLIYQSGHATIPAAVKEATILAASMMYRVVDNDPTMQSERIGDYSYTLRSNSDVTNSIMSTLRPMLSAYRILSV